VEDGRSFVRRSTDKFQVIQATLVDTWASTAAGAFALSENNLYTTDAFRDYLSHLTADGMVCFTRWGFEPPRESLRLVSLAMAALDQLGETQPWRHVIVGRDGSVQGFGAKDTVLVSRKPLGEAEIDRARSLFAAAHMEGVGSPQPVPRSASQPQSGGIPAQLHLRHHPGERQPALLFLYRAAARLVEFRQNGIARERGL
jgi:hypothetical protein